MTSAPFGISIAPQACNWSSLLQAVLLSTLLALTEKASNSAWARWPVHTPSQHQPLLQREWQERLESCSRARR